MVIDVVLMCSVIYSLVIHKFWDVFIFRCILDPSYQQTTVQITPWGWGDVWMCDPHRCGVMGD